MKNKHKNSSVQGRFVLFAVLAAALYALNSPVSKLLLNKIEPVMTAAFLYLGAGAGLLIVRLLSSAAGRKSKELPLSREDTLYVVLMIALDIAAPIFLMLGLKYTSAASVSLLNNFEIVATAVIAFVFFKEEIPKKLLLGISLITTASIILSAEDFTGLSFSFGSVFVIAACVCWGLENNCTRKLSAKDPLQTVVVKGIGSGTGSLIIAIVCGEAFPELIYIPAAMATGFVAYGLSIYFYIYAQRGLGAAKTSAYYAIAPFIGVILSLLIFRQLPSVYFIVALAVMALGTYFTNKSGQNGDYCE